MPWRIVLLLFIGGLAIPTSLFVLYCHLSSSDRRSNTILLSIFRYAFYILLALLCLYGFLSYFRSCSATKYREGYEAGYEAGVEVGIDMVKEDPSEFFG